MATRIVNGVVFHIESTNTLVAVLDSAADVNLSIEVIITASSLEVVIFIKILKLLKIKL